MRWIYVVDDSPLFVNRVREVVDELPEAALLGLSDNLKDAWMEIREWKPDIAVVDLQLGEESGLVLLRRIKKELPDVRVIMTTGSLFPQYRERCLQAGADGFVSKAGDPARELARALRACMEG
jgi:two-component system response regulator EvgA